MTTALFTNYSNEDFEGFWDGKGKVFRAGESLWMPDYLARHFALHLANRELLRKDENGIPVYKDGEKMTSPKKPEDFPIFMELFNKGYKPENGGEELGDKNDDIDALIDSANKNREEKGLVDEVKKTTNQNPNEPQVVLSPDFDEDDDEESFEGAPKDTPIDDNQNTAPEGQQIVTPENTGQTPIVSQPSSDIQVK